MKFCPWVALLNDERVTAGETGADGFTEEEIRAIIIEHLELNRKEYDRVLFGAEAAAYNWHRDYNGLKEDQRWLIATAVPEVIANDKLKIANNTAKCLRVATKRIIDAGFGVNCTRCGGTGHYSRNYRGQTYCYKCLGTKLALPKLTKKLKAEIEKHFNETK